MKITRRSFLGAVSAAAAVMLQFKGNVFGQRALVPGDPFSRLNWGSFLPFINTEFVFKGSGGIDVPLTLVDMTDSRPFNSAARKRGQENFVMKFSGPSWMPLEQGTYVVEHFNLGEFNLFITEGAIKGRTRQYFAVVNRVVS